MVIFFSIADTVANDITTIRFHQASLGSWRVSAKR